MVYILSINGNIGSGKSTLVSELASKLKRSVVTLLEPIEKWAEPVLEDGHSMLGAFYLDPEKNALAFQMYVLITRVHQIEEALLRTEYDALIIIERGPWFDLELMARPMYVSGLLSEIEWKSYNMLNDLMVSRLPKIDAIVYLRTGVAECTARIKSRDRVDERGRIDVSYLTAVHDAHDAYFMTGVPVCPLVRVLQSASDTPPGVLVDSVLDWFDHIGV
jgi:deoxyadenosine/deoxycytidine kinase